MPNNPCTSINIRILQQHEHLVAEKQNPEHISLSLNRNSLTKPTFESIIYNTINNLEDSINP